MVAEFTNLEGRHGYLVYALFDRQGRPLSPPGSMGTLDRIRGRLASWSGGEPAGRDGEVVSYQLQVFVDGEAPPTPAEKASDPRPLRRGPRAGRRGWPGRPGG